MLIEFDQTTMANKTAALEHACNKLPQGHTRKSQAHRRRDDRICAVRNPKRLRKPRVQDFEGDHPLSPAWAGGIAMKLVGFKPVLPGSFQESGIGNIAVNGECGEGEQGTVAGSVPESKFAG